MERPLASNSHRRSPIPMEKEDKKLNPKYPTKEGKKKFNFSSRSNCYTNKTQMGMRKRS